MNKNLENLLLASYIAESSYNSDYWTLTKSDFAEKISQIGLESLHNPEQKNKFINSMVKSFLPITGKKPEWTQINEFDAFLIADLEIDGKKKRFISLRGTELNGFWGKNAIFTYFLDRYLNFSKSYQPYKQHINNAIKEIENNPEYDQVVLCGHSYGGAMVSEFFRQQENKKYKTNIIGATFGSPGAGENVVANHSKNILKLISTFSNIIKKSLGFNVPQQNEVIENLYEFKNSKDPIPLIGKFLGGYQNKGNTFNFSWSKGGHSISSSYVENIKKLYLEEANQDDTMFKILRQANLSHVEWKEEFEFAKQHPLNKYNLNHIDEESALRASCTITRINNIFSKESKIQNKNWIQTIKEYYYKVFPKETNYSEYLKAEDYLLKLQEAQLAGHIRGFNKKSLQKRNKL